MACAAASSPISTGQKHDLSVQHGTTSGTSTLDCSQALYLDASDKEEIECRVRSMDGSWNCSIRTLRGATVKEIRAAVAESAGVPACEAGVVVGDHVLTDDGDRPLLTYAANGFADFCFVHVLEPIRLAQAEHTRLLNKDSSVSEQAVRVLAELGESGAPYLAALLRDSAAGGRALAAAELGNLGQVAQPFAAELAAALVDGDPSLREAAAVSLGKIGPAVHAHLSALAFALGDAEWRVRTAAALSLRCAGQAAAPYAGELAAALSDNNVMVRVRAAQALAGSILRDGELSVLRSMDAYGDTDYEHGAGCIPALVDAVQDEYWQVQVYAAEALALLGNPWGLPHLAKLIRGEPRYARRFAAVALQRLGPLAAPYVSEIAEALREDMSAYVREEAAKALGNMGDAARPEVPLLERAMLEDLEAVKFEAEQALRSLEMKADVHCEGDHDLRRVTVGEGDCALHADVRVFQCALCHSVVAPGLAALRCQCGYELCTRCFDISSRNPRPAQTAEPRAAMPPLTPFAPSGPAPGPQKSGRVWRGARYNPAAEVPV